MKIVINSCYGGFGLSDEAILMYGDVKKLNLQALEQNRELRFKTYYIDGIRSEETYFSDRQIARDDKELVAIVEILGEKANGQHARLRIVEVPDDVKWEIHEYDGKEWVAEVHRTWY